MKVRDLVINLLEYDMNTEVHIGDKHTDWSPNRIYEDELRVVIK